MLTTTNPAITNPATASATGTPDLSADARRRPDAIAAAEAVLRDAGIAFEVVADLPTAASPPAASPPRSRDVPETGGARGHRPLAA